MLELNLNHVSKRVYWQNTTRDWWEFDVDKYYTYFMLYVRGNLSPHFCSNQNGQS